MDDGEGTRALLHGGTEVLPTHRSDAAMVGGGAVVVARRSYHRCSIKATLNLDPLSSPHLEEDLIGGMVDLDLLSCFPKDGQESLEGSRGIKLSKMCNNGGEREQKVHLDPLKRWGRRTP